MKSRTTSTFRKQFAALPNDVREQARAAYRLFVSNPRHPSLHFKKVHTTEPVVSVRGAQLPSRGSHRGIRHRRLVLDRTARAIRNVTRKSVSAAQQAAGADAAPRGSAARSLAMKQRARALEDKAERSAAILKAARELWFTNRDFSMTDVAKRAGIVKGTIYLYFKTREELMAAVVEQLIEECFDDIDRQLQKRRGRWSAEQVAGVFERALRGRVPIADALKLARPRLEKTAALLESRYPPLGEVIALLGGKRAARSSRRRRRS